MENLLTHGTAVSYNGKQFIIQMTPDLLEHRPDGRVHLWPADAGNSQGILAYIPKVEEQNAGRIVFPGDPRLSSQDEHDRPQPIGGVYQVDLLPKEVRTAEGARARDAWNAAIKNETDESRRALQGFWEMARVLWPKDEVPDQVDNLVHYWLSDELRFGRPVGWSFEAALVHIRKVAAAIEEQTRAQEIDVDLPAVLPSDATEKSKAYDRYATAIEKQAESRLRPAVGMIQLCDALYINSTEVVPGLIAAHQEKQDFFGRMASEAATKAASLLEEAQAEAHRKLVISMYEYDPAAARKKPKPTSIDDWFVGSYQGREAWSDGVMVDLGKPHLSGWEKRLSTIRHHPDRPMDIERVMPRITQAVDLRPFALQENSNGSEVVHFAWAEDQAVTMNLKYVRYFRSKYTGTRFVVDQAYNGLGPVAIFDGDVLVGAVMPMRSPHQLQDIRALLSEKADLQAKANEGLDAVEAGADHGSEPKQEEIETSAPHPSADQPLENYWRIGGIPSEQEHAGRVGVNRGYEREDGADMVRIEFVDGTSDLFSPYSIFPSSKQEFDAQRPGIEAAPEPGKKITDVGENLWYNRRNFVDGGIRWDDIKDLNDTLKIKEAVKARIWPRPNYEQLAAEGLHPFFAHIVKQIYDGISNTPKTRGAPSDDDLMTYIDTVRKVREATLNWVKEGNHRDTLEGLMASFIQAYGSRRDYMAQMREVGNPKNIILDRVWPFSSTNAYGNRFNSNSEYNRQAILIGGNRAITAMTLKASTARDAVAAINDGWPAKQEAWQKSLRVEKKDDVAGVVSALRYLKDQSEPAPVYLAQIGGLTVQPFDREEDAEIFLGTIKPWVLLNKKTGRIRGDFGTREEAVSAAQELVKRAVGKSFEARGMNIDEAQRSGPAWRKEGEDITAQRLMETFGFRGVNFGREGWIKQDERQAYLNHTYDSLMDLTEVLQISPAEISFGGRLGIAFGAQGRGGAHGAHFVPGVDEINLTRTQGAGPLAHEFGHAFDHRLAVLAGLGKNSDPYLSSHASRLESIEGVPPQILVAYKAVMSKIHYREATPEEVSQQQTAEHSRFEKLLSSWITHFRNMIIHGDSENQLSQLEQFDADAQLLLEGRDGDEMVQTGNKRYPEVIARMRETVREARGRLPTADETDNLYSAARIFKSILSKGKSSGVSKVDTNFRKESKAKDHAKGGKSYWAENSEMFARTFELYVADKLEEMGRTNTFLSNAAIMAEMIDESGGYALPYPRDNERKAIFLAMNDLVASSPFVQVKPEPAAKPFAEFEERRNGSLFVKGDPEALADYIEGFAGKVAKESGGVILSKAKAHHRQNIPVIRERLASGAVVDTFEDGGVMITTSTVNTGIARDRNEAEGLFAESYGPVLFRSTFGKEPPADAVERYDETQREIAERKADAIRVEKENEARERAQTAEANAIAAGAARKAEEDRRHKWQETIASGNAENPRYQAFLDTVENPSAIGSNAEYMAWINARVVEFEKERGKRPVMPEGHGTAAYDNELTAYVRRWADVRLADRLKNKAAEGNQGFSGLTDSPINLASHDDFMARLRDGAVSMEEYHARFRGTIDALGDLQQELSAMTKDRLLKRLDSMGAYRYKNDVKSTVLDAAVQEIVRDFTLARSYSYSIGSGNFREAQIKAVAALVEASTEQDLKTFAERVSSARKEREERLSALKKSLENPETLEEFDEFIRYRKGGESALSPEQRIRYDELRSLEQKAKQMEAAESRSILQAVNVGSVEMNIVETVHTRDKYPIFVVQLSDRVEREVFEDLNAKAKQLGGWYSSYRANGAIPGFQFKERDAAEKFMALREGNVSNKERVEARKEEKRTAAVERLREMADRLEERASESLGRDRMANTARRARLAAGAESQARAEKALAETMCNLASAIEEGRAVHLEGVRQKVQIELLGELVSRAKHERLRKEYPSYGDYEKHKDRPAEAGDVDFVEWPSFSAGRGELLSMARAVGEQKNASMLSSKLARLASSISDDQRVDVDRDIVEKVLEKLPGSVHVPWHWPNNRDNLNRLKAMNIESLPVLRAALREYVQYRGKKSEADRARELERALAGNKNVGIDFFPTPPNVVSRVIELAGVESGMKVLEPSAGTGNIAQAIRQCGVEPHVAEISLPLREILEAKNFKLAGQDFMGMEPEMDHVDGPGPIEGSYDRILMNPPFSNGMDIEHVRHAYRHLKPGGRLVAIMSEGPFFRSDRKAIEFRDWLDAAQGWSERLPENSFMDRTQLKTTGVASRIVVIDKPEDRSLAASPKRHEAVTQGR